MTQTAPNSVTVPPTDTYNQALVSNLHPADWQNPGAADAAARILIQNELFAPFGIGRRRLSSLTMPWCTYTDPEVAHVGMPASEVARRQDVRTLTSTASVDLHLWSKN